MRRAVASTVAEVVRLMEPGVLCFCNGGITAMVRFFGSLRLSFEDTARCVIFFCVIYHILYIVFYTVCYNESIKR